VLTVNNTLINNDTQSSGESDPISLSESKSLLKNKFEIFYKSYPKKKAKIEAEKAFSKLNPDDTLLNAMLSAIDKAKKSEDWMKDKGRYIPYPATWINAKRWLDEETESHPLAGTISDKTIRTVGMLDDWRPPA